MAPREWGANMEAIGKRAKIEVNMSMRLAASLSVFALASCSPTDNPDRTGEAGCRQYLTDTGYDIIDGGVEKTKIMNALGVPAREQPFFCVGRLPKPDGGVCHLALPSDERTDGDYTDCPVDLQR